MSTSALASKLRAEVAASDAFRAFTASDQRVELTGASVEARALVLAALRERVGKPLAVIVPGDASIGDFESALRLFHSEPQCVSTYPSPALSPYQEVGPAPGVVREEVRALGMLVDGRADLLIVPVRALFARLPRPQAFRSRILTFAAGADIDVQETLEALVENGFVRTDLVGDAGEFAFRGGILDVFPPNAQRPVRIELFGDTIDTVRWFDPETQRSEDDAGDVVVLPMAQLPLARDVRKTLARRLSLDFNEPIYKRDLAQKVERLNENGTFPGIEHYLPVATDTVSFAGYLDGWSLALVEPEQITTSVAKYESLLRTEYEHAAEQGRAAYPPEKLLTPGIEILEFIGRARIALSEVHFESRRSDFTELRVHAPQTDRYGNRLPEFAADVTRAFNDGKRQIFFAATRGGAEKVERLLKEFNVPFAVDAGVAAGGPPASSPASASDVSLQPPAPRGLGRAGEGAGAPNLGPELLIASGHLARGFELGEISLVAYSEWDLFEPPTSTRIGSKKRKTDAFATDLRDLKPGDLIVHVDHGVGRFLGLRRIPFGDTEREVMEIEYSGGGKLLMPMENLNLIQKYSGGGEEAAPHLDKLGGTTWARKKASVKKAMRDMADELLKLYATRQMVRGHAFSKDSPWQFEFEEAFEFDETDDQNAAIDDVKADMESRKPMDRLLCGDVGYGKTEVAMRAAFKSVMDGKQVAVLAPTTILTYQHYRTFLRRFASFPVTIELLTRYYSAKEQREIVQKLERGEIDIIVGTHRLLSKDINFKDLGLVIIDEEQRFGVAQKEKLKQLKKAVDVLAMSATPIPRTLHMSMVGIRDISVIETPPKDRLAIQTALVPFDDEFIRDAIAFEVDRGGQVFFVHNRVESIYGMKDYLERLVPGIRVAVGHGQMDERELERVMLAFIQREFDVLLATTIIENGIDIPACNTILINHAERFGLSQLYQLRGRVGRSDRLAFCYLLVPSDKVLTSDARKRLAAIQEFSDLGAGFRIAAKDLEIRGSGNILGGEQSGEIAAVGFEMYTKLLDEAIRELKGEKIEEEVSTSMNLGVDIYIPQDYIADESLRMTFYKKIASATTDTRVEDIRNEMRDRFGALPANVENLLRFVKVKHFAQQLGVISVVREGARGVVKLTPQAKIDPTRLLQLIQQDSAIKFSPNGVLSFPIRAHGPEVIDVIEELLRAIAA